MDELSFIAAIVQAVVWPIFLVVILLVFRRPIVFLLSGAKIRYKEIEISLSTAKAYWDKTQPILVTSIRPEVGPPFPGRGNAEKRGDDESNGN